MHCSLLITHLRSTETVGARGVILFELISRFVSQSGNLWIKQRKTSHLIFSLTFCPCCK
uniref:Uncharacterized protein n=1 Tax=Anguilla anguilla TaxID=7936 RepID=A0A0E9S2G8_ANGAN